MRSSPYEPDHHTVHNILILVVGLLLLAGAGVAIFYIMIYPKQHVDYIELQYNGTALPLSDRAQQMIDQLHGSSFADLDPAKLASTLQQEGEIETVTVSKSYPGKVYITITCTDPIAVLTLSAGNYIVKSDEQGNEIIITDMIITDTGAVFDGYDSLVETLGSHVPVCTIDTTDGLITNELTIDPRFFCYLMMLQGLQTRSERIYNLLTEIKYDTTNHSELKLRLSQGDTILQYEIVDPISSDALAQAIRLTSSMVEDTGRDKIVQFSVFDTYVVIDHDTMTADKGVGFGIR